MPRLPTDYSKTVIYVLKCKDDNVTEEYIGSTTDFTKRKNQHKSDCNNENRRCYNQKNYKFIRENGGWSNWLMIELEKYPCNDKREAEYREEKIRVERNATLNMKRAFTTEEQLLEYKKQYKEQYKEQNKDQITEYHKQYKKQNKEQIAEKSKQYREQNREQISEHKKQYYDQNKEQILEKSKQYYEQNKKQLLEQKKQYINKEYICNCGWVGTNSTKRTHIPKCENK